MEGRRRGDRGHKQERRGEEESAEGRGRGREKVWGKNFNAD
jgi:hypothetical protein